MRPLQPAIHITSIDLLALQSQARVEVRGKILVVDDDPVFCRLVAEKLETAGFIPLIAKECSEAIGLMADHSPSFILLDLSFPPDVAQGGLVSWDGFRLLRWLRGMRNAAGARFIIISSDESIASKQEAKKCGVLDFIPKPVNFDRLLSIIRAKPAMAQSEPA